MQDSTKKKVHDTLYNYCKEFLNVQEITHAATQIANASDDEVDNVITQMTTYLDSFDTMRFGCGAGQSYLLPTSTTRGLTSNNVRFAMAEIRALIKAETSSRE